jgi:glycosyltransferase involved in cell wall biosynthesis
MRILHVSSAKSWRGGEQQVAYLVNALTKAGVEQQLACREDGELFRRMQGQCELIPYKKVSALNLQFAIRLKRYAKCVDIVHVHDSHAHTAAYIAALLGSNTPVVVHRRVDFPIGKSRLSLNKYNHDSIARILCVSDLIKHVVQERLREPQKATTVYSGVDVNRFAPSSSALHELLNIPTTTKLVGNSSALADHKDYPTFLRTAAKVLESHNNVHFVVFGDGEERNTIEQQAKELGIDDKLHLTGFRNDLQKLLPCLDVFFMPSKTEGLGTSILDAFAAKIPVVATRAGGIPEIVLHNKTGLLGEVGNETTLSQHLLRILNDAALSHTLIAGAQTHLASFSVAAMGNKTLSIYREILKNTGHS